MLGLQVVVAATIRDNDAAKLASELFQPRYAKEAPRHM
jgi:hypothetical protein